MNQNNSDDLYDVPETDEDLQDHQQGPESAAVAALSVLAAVIVIIGWMFAYQFGKVTSTLFLIDQEENDFATIGYFALAVASGGFTVAFISTVFILCKRHWETRWLSRLELAAGIVAILLVGAGVVGQLAANPAGG